jgi:hypothetical protein
MKIVKVGVCAWLGTLVLAELDEEKPIPVGPEDVTVWHHDC